MPKSSRKKASAANTVATPTPQNGLSTHSRSFSDISHTKTEAHKSAISDDRQLQAQYQRDGDDSSDEELESACNSKWLESKTFSVINTESIVTKLYSLKEYEVKEALKTICPGIFIDRGKSISLADKNQKTIINFNKKNTEKTEIEKACCVRFSDLAKGEPAHVKFTTFLKKIKNGPTEEIVRQETKPLKLDLKWSLILQDAGIRLLYSEAVAEKYHRLKEKLFPSFTNLPDAEAVEDMLVQTINNSLKELGINRTCGKRIITSNEFSDIKAYYTKYQRHIFPIRHATKAYYSKENVLSLMKSIVGEPKDPSELRKTVWKNESETLITSFAKRTPDFITPKTKKVSSAKKIQSSFKRYLSNTKNTAPEVTNAIYKAYESNKKQGLDTLKTNTKNLIQDLTSAPADDDYLIDTFVRNLYEVSASFRDLNGAKFVRPTLDYHVDSSQLAQDTMTTIPETSSDVSGEDEVTTTSSDKIQPTKSTAIDFFVFIRLAHRSLTRSIKNSQDCMSFDGAQFMLNWSFADVTPENGGRSLRIFEPVTLSSNKSLSSMVLYNGNFSSYRALSDRMKKYKADEGKSDLEIARYMIQLLKGPIEDDFGFSVNLKQFLQFLTYHLFVCEVHRHPAAAIHHIMALDLIKNNVKQWEDILMKLPMSIKGAVSVTGGLQNIFFSRQEIPYLYDKNKTKLKTFDDEIFQVFHAKEDALLEAWLKYKKLKKQNPDDVLKALNKLCSVYFGELGYSGEVTSVSKNLNEAFENVSD